jgi:predicted NAD-dependent protein-ADP-ribosyltransferase YbiA (DUF1768 family)
MDTLMLSNPKVQPFGLLSNKAVTEITVENIQSPYNFKNGIWKTVTQFAYVNMFKKPKYRKIMNEKLSPDPFLSMTQIREEADKEMFDDELFKGMYEKFRQNKELRERLYETRGKQLVYDKKEIVSILNNIRLHNNQYVFDLKQNINVPRTEVLQVINGVEEEIKRNPASLSDDLDYSALKKYAKRTGYKNLPLNDEIFININHIVPIIKYRLREPIWKEQVDRFKDHLLDLFLDDILEKDYPNLNYSQYQEAKRQQIEKEPNVQVYKDQLYDFYMKGLKGADNILSKLTFSPDETLKQMGQSSAQIEEKIMLPEAQIEKIYLNDNDPFLPSFIENITIDGKIYQSVIHYIYAQLLRNLLEIGEVPYLKNYDITTIDIKNIVNVYSNVLRDWVTYTLKNNNEIALKEKINQYPTLGFLLQATRNHTIIWNDRTDPILGVGNDDRGLNQVGLLMEHLREVNQPTPNRFLLSYGSISGNIWTNSWMGSIAQDLKNTMLLLENPRTSDLDAIYSTPSIDGVPDKNDMETLTKAGLDKEQIEIAFPIILGMYINMKNKTVKDLMYTEANKYFIQTKYKKGSKEFNNNLRFATTKLSKLSEKVQLKEGVSAEKFIMSILSNKQTDDEANVKINRVYIWSE